MKYKNQILNSFQGKIKNCIAIVAMAMIINACDEYKVYEQELYKQVIALICSDNFNILTDTQQLGEDVVGYVAVSCGGTGAPTENVRIKIIEDERVLEAYNWNRYESDQAKYDKRLPASKYHIDDYQIVIPQGERSGKMKIWFRPDGLSPDSAYYLPLAIESVSAYEVNPKKSNTLYRVLIKNLYAEQMTIGHTTYRMNGYRDVSSITVDKQMQPLTTNKVRMMAGNLEFSTSLADIEARAVVLEVTGDRVKITPYKGNGSLIIKQIDGDPDYPNTFKMTHEWDKRFKVFLLHYKYKAGVAPEVEMREELKLEFIDQ